ncbi:CoA ester lyase [Cytobacillus oceanisediminis]
MGERSNRDVAWRSLLYVPANRPKFVSSAAKRGADAVILDLEDSVPHSEKDNARAGLQSAVDTVAESDSDILVRVNRSWSLLVPDLEALVSPSVKAINLPKVDDPGVVRVVDEMLCEIEARRGLPIGHTKIFARVESARGVRHIDTILSASDRVVATAIGTGDLSLESRLAPGSPAIHHAFVEVTLAARSRGVTPLGLAGLIVDFTDLVAFREVALASKDLGSEGAPCIHPAQVSVLNEVFGIDPVQIQEAKKVVAAFEVAAAEGRGSLMLGETFIDVANYDAARRLLDAAASRALTA